MGNMVKSDKCERSSCENKAVRVISDSMFAYFKVCQGCYEDLISFNYDNGIKTKSMTLEEFKQNVLPKLNVKT